VLVFITGGSLRTKCPRPRGPAEDAPSAAAMRGVLSASGLASQRAFTVDADSERLLLT
jgi:hypothetical protein